MEPATFGKYQLCERLGEGGMAVVFRAKLHGPGGFEKVLCLKQIRGELAARPEFIDLFVAEAKLTVSLTHSNIVPVYELGMVDGTYFLALELIDGPPLAQLIAEGPAPAPLAAYIVEQVLRGLDYAHRRGVVHRDLSSANVLVSRDGEVKIVDFGIAAQASASAVQGGSRGYIAPEQEAGGRVDARSDLYGVGVLLWELCAGRRFDGSLGDAPDALQTIIERASERDPEARFPDAAAMLSQVARYLRDADGPTQAELSEFVRRRCPDVVAPRAEPTDVEVGEVDGPRTVPVAGRTNKEVTFATRIQLPQKPAAGSAVAAALSLVAGIAALGALAVLKGPAAVASGVDKTLNGSANVAANENSKKPANENANPGAKPAANVKLGHLSVRTVPAGAEVRWGERVLGASPLEVDVPVAAAALKLRARGFAPFERAVDAAAFTGTPPTFSVSEKLRALGKGTLTLGAIPWAHVTVDGEKKRDTPIVGLSLPAGAHQVWLQCPATGREIKLTVNIDPDAEVKRVVDLNGEPKIIE
ncbi:MAG TPA: serine/threonine-protein kinase [Polyangia bacterium]|nr:serine/threonine-protein kinase [Polyangia bacterium]